MRRFPVVLLMLLSATTQAEDEYKGSVYGYFTGGGCQHGYGIVGGGAGAEGFLWRGLTIGIEGGAHTYVNDKGFGDLHMPVGYHFVDRKKSAKVDPFVSFSPAGLFYRTSGNGIGYATHGGGGVTYWFKPRLGVRMEFRVHTFGYDEVTAQGRIGISYRF